MVKYKDKIWRRFQDTEQFVGALYLCICEC